MRGRPQFFLAEVARAERVTPGMVRVVLGGPDLRGFTSTGVPDERLGVYFPRPGQREPQRPTITGGMWSFADPGNEPEVRSYTVRRFDAGRAELTVDFVVHARGVATDWALGARPGDVVGLSTAGGWYRPPPGAGLQLLVGDATALPAIGRILEQAPAGARVRVVAEVACAQDRQWVETAAEVAYTWLVGSGLGAGPSRLPAAVAELPATDFPGADFPGAGLPGAGTYAWVAGEASATRAIRKHLRAERGLGGAFLTVLGYWREGKEEFLARYRPAEEAMLARYAALARSGLAGQELVDAWDAELERNGF